MIFSISLKVCHAECARTMHWHCTIAPLFSYASVFFSSHIIDSQRPLPLVRLAKFLGSATFRFYYRCVLKVLDYKQYGLTESNVVLSGSRTLQVGDTHLTDVQEVSPDRQGSAEEIDNLNV